MFLRNIKTGAALLMAVLYAGGGVCATSQMSTTAEAASQSQVQKTKERVSQAVKDSMVRTFNVNVVDKSYTTCGKPVSGVKYRLYTDSACKIAAKTAEGKTAQIVSGSPAIKLKSGTYYMKCISTPQGWKEDSNTGKVTILYDKAATTATANIYRDFDLQTNYTGQLRQSGCVPTSIANVVRTYLGKDLSTKAANSQIRTALNDWEKGLSVIDSLKHMKTKYNFTYAYRDVTNASKATKESRFEEALSHVKQGKMGLISVKGGAFSSGGHCEAIVGYKGNKLAIWDPAYIWHKDNLKKYGIECDGNGLIFVSKSQINGITKYYLITKNK